MSWPGRGCLSKGENGGNTILVQKAGINVFPEVSGRSGSGQRNSLSARLMSRLGTCSAALGHTVTWRAETLLWPPGASALNHTSFCLIYICFEKNGDPEIEGRKARLPRRLVLGTISKDTNISMLRTPPGPGAPGAVLSRGSLHPGMWSRHLRHDELCQLLFRVKRDRGLWVCLRRLLTLRKMLAHVFQ